MLIVWVWLPSCLQVNLHQNYNHQLVPIFRNYMCWEWGEIYRKSCCRILSSSSKKLLQNQREVRSHSDLSRRCRDRAAPGGDRIHSSAVPCFQREDAQHFPALCYCSCSLIKTRVLDLWSQTGLKSSPTHHPQTLWETGLSMAPPPVWLGKEVQQQLGRCWLVPEQFIRG